MLGFGLAAMAIGPVAAQTVVGGDDGRPEVTVDRSVLDQLGPQPTLPDMLLGRQPMPSPTAPVKLHPPHARSAVAEAKTARPAAGKLAEAATEPKAPKLTKLSKKTKASATVATATQPSTADQAPATTQSSTTPGLTQTAEAKPAPAAPSKPVAGKPNKNLTSTFAPPPPPESKPTVVANADMPGASAPLTPPPTQPEPPAGKPAKPSKPLTSSVGMNADTAGAPPAKPAETPAPAPAQSPNSSMASSSSAAVPSAPPVPQTPAPEAKTETKTAMLTPPPAATTAPAGEGVVLSVPFVKDGAVLPNDMLPGLVSLAKRAEADPSLQLQVMAYASGDADNASKAQRLSLARALAVRAFLKDQGVPGARIDVRALGNRVPQGPPDRVDLVEQKH